jgi:hypothetical protein
MIFLSIRQSRQVIGCKRLLAALESSQLSDDLVDDTRDISVGSNGRNLGELALGLGNGGEAAGRGVDGGNIDVDELGKEADDLVNGGDDLLLVDSDGGALGWQSWDLNWELRQLGKVEVNVDELGEQTDDAVDDLDDLGLVDADLALGGQGRDVGGDAGWKLGELGKVDVDVDQLSQELDDRVDNGDDLGLVDADLTLDGEFRDVDGKLWESWNVDRKGGKVDRESGDVQGALDGEFRERRNIDWEFGKLWDVDGELGETKVALDGKVKGKVNWELWELRDLWGWQARRGKIDGGGGREGNKAGKDSRVTHLEKLGWWVVYEEL